MKKSLALPGNMRTIGAVVLVVSGILTGCATYKAPTMALGEGATLLVADDHNGRFGIVKVDGMYVSWGAAWQERSYGPIDVSPGKHTVDVRWGTLPSPCLSFTAVRGGRYTVDGEYYESGGRWFFNAWVKDATTSRANDSLSPSEQTLQNVLQKQRADLHTKGIESGPATIEYPDGRKVILDAGSPAVVKPTRRPKPAATSRAVSASPTPQESLVVKDTAIPPDKQKAKNARLFTLPLSKDVQYVGNEFIFFGTLLNVEMNISAGGVKSVATYQCKTEDGTTPNGFFLAFDETAATFTLAASNADGQTSLFRITGVISQTGRTILLTDVNVELAEEHHGK